METESVRGAIVDRLCQDLLGPIDEIESISSKPSDQYITGILWPSRTQVNLIEDDGSDGESEDDDISPNLSIAGQQRPSAMGLSFAVLSERDIPSINVSYSFGTYKAQGKNTKTEKNQTWQRVQHDGVATFNLKPEMSEFFLVKAEELPLNLEVSLHIRCVRFESKLLTTVTLLNRTQISDEDSTSQEEMTIFQTKLRISTGASSEFAGMPDLREPFDEDEESSRFLYRNSASYAFGHQCSAGWQVLDDHLAFVETNWIPTYSVPSFKQNGHQVFANLVKSGSLSAEIIACGSDEQVFSSLDQLATNYAEWIKIQTEITVNIESKFERVSNKHLKNCTDVHSRIVGGIAFLKRDKMALKAFRFANYAMHKQHSWKAGQSGWNSNLEWRPFQIGFILMAIESVCNSRSEDRETLDLLWFPTGGGKTEAYLALIATGAWYRRLTDKVLHGAGNFAIMRYTLRLLTAQQFERAAAVILACEGIRKGLYPDISPAQLDKAEFSIGLWVGKDATPNSYDDGLAHKGNDYESSAEQLRNCYACHIKLFWKYDNRLRTIRPECRSPNCEIGVEFGTWPVITVDDDIYATEPTLIIGTVDKFAQLPTKIEMSKAFGFQTEHGTDLIIQDELHLISGPLGTIVGLYETAFDWLLTKDGKKPKIIGSTATIRRAGIQVRALFDRESCQFPPSGLNFDDSGFAVIDHEKPGRLYVGVTTAGRSAKFTVQGVTGSLLQSSVPNEELPIDQVDGYTTLLMYFNALRELGGAIVQVLDDVPDSMELYAKRRFEKVRDIDAPKELTSRVSQRDIVSILNDLSKSFDQDDAVDVVLATNMVSVGVDVPRLGLMLVNGQPKTRSEYIQSTSRVGRSSYPGLVVCVFNAMKARDRSHFETFSTIHQALYKDVEATSVTPFASRARDRALRAVLVAMVRNSDKSLESNPDFSRVDIANLKSILFEIERRVKNIDPDSVSDVERELDAALQEWSSRGVKKYLDRSLKGMRFSLLQTAEDFARKIASGNFGGSAWPILNTMRSVEAATPFRLKEKIFRGIATKNMETGNQAEDTSSHPWRRPIDT